MTKEIVRYTLPLKPEEVTNIFLKSGEVDFEISVDGQDPKTSIMFLKNLKKPINVVEFDEEFLKEYMVSSHLIWATNLTKVHANILYFNKYGNVLYSEVLGEFSVKLIENFVNSERELVNAQREFLESMPLFLTVSTMIVSEEVEDSDGLIKTMRNDTKAMEFVEHGIPSEHIIEVDTPLIGFNIVQVCNLENYLFRYIDESDIFYMLRAKWFSKFFEEYKFDKRYLIAWIEPTSFAKNILAMYKYLDSNKYKVKDGFAVPCWRDRAKLKFKSFFNFGNCDA